MTADTVHHLRLHGGAGSDAVAQRHRAEAAVASGLPAPRGLPAGALLCVRRLALRLPGGALATVARQAAPALQRQLDEAWSQALRPAAASPGAAVPALWFADEAELLVFLARRARAGDTAAWWWPVLAGRQAEPWAAVAAAWRQRPEAVPAAVVALDGEAVSVAAAMGDAACESLALALATAFGVRGWGGRGAEAPSPARGAAAGRRASPADVVAGPVPALPALTPKLGLRRASVQTVGHPTSGTDDHPPAPGPAAPAQRLVALARVLAREPWAASSADLVNRVLQEVAALATPRPASTRDPALDGPECAIEVSAASSPMPQGAPAARLALPGVQVPASPAGASPAVVHAGRHEPALGPVPLPASRPARGTSPHAGLFFLLPLLLRHGCYGDFSEPARPGLALHPAWLLHALLRRLAPAVPGDPLPALLKGWAGGARRPRAPGLPQPWRPWFQALVQALQADAARLLARPPRGTLAWLVRQPGWVQLGASRLDVGFSLQTHPFAIRAAGLDRDIGWLPAAGRHVAFHFDTPPGAAA